MPSFTALKIATERHLLEGHPGITLGDSVGLQQSASDCTEFKGIIRHPQSGQWLSGCIFPVSTHLYVKEPRESCEK